MRFRTLAVFCAALACSCGPSVEDVRAEQGPAFHARVAAINALAPVLRAQPRCEANHLDLSGVHLDLRAMLIFDELAENRFPNTLLIHEEDLPLSARTPPQIPIRLYGVEEELFAAVRGFAQPDDYDTAAALLRGAELVKRARYLMVVRRRHYRAAETGDTELAQNETGGLDSRTSFHPGIYQGEAIVLEIAPARAVGCLVFEAESPGFRLDNPTVGDLRSIGDGSLLARELGAVVKAQMLVALRETDPRSEFECHTWNFMGSPMTECPARLERRRPH
jgi:hypothetical protein